MGLHSSAMSMQFWCLHHGLQPLSHSVGIFTGLMLVSDGTIRVLVGRLSVSDSRTNKSEPVRLLFTDVSGSIACYVSDFRLFSDTFIGLVRVQFDGTVRD